MYGHFPGASRRTSSVDFASSANCPPSGSSFRWYPKTAGCLSYFSISSGSTAFAAADEKGLSQAGLPRGSNPLALPPRFLPASSKFGGTSQIRLTPLPAILRIVSSDRTSSQAVRGTNGFASATQTLADPAQS